MSIVFLYGSVSPSPTYSASGLPQAFRFVVTTCLFEEGVFLKVFVNVQYFYRFSKTSNRRESQFDVESLSNFVLISHMDPLGDQNDVQEFSIYCVIFGICG